MRLNIKQIEAFYRVFVAGSVTAAAQHLHVSQPAVSRLVADLEAAVGLSLFERKKRRLAPTPEGRMLFEEIEKAFVGLEKISARAAEIRAFRVGSVRIAAMPALSYSVLPAVIKQFIASYPGIHISLDIRNSGSVFDWLSPEQMDFGIAALPAYQTVAQVELLPSPPCRCVVHRDSSLADKPVVTPEDLVDIPFISLMPSSMLRRRVDAAFQAAGVQRQMAIETPYSLSAMQFTKLGLGVTIVDPFSAHALGGASVVSKPFEPSIPYEFGLLFPGQISLSRAAERFLDMLKQELNRYWEGVPIGGGQ